MVCSPYSFTYCYTPGTDLKKAFRNHKRRCIEKTLAPGCWSDDVEEHGQDGVRCSRRVDKTAQASANILAEDQHGHPNFWFLDPVDVKLVGSTYETICLLFFLEVDELSLYVEVHMLIVNFFFFQDCRMCPRDRIRRRQEARSRILRAFLQPKRVIFWGTCHSR